MINLGKNRKVQNVQQNITVSNILKGQFCRVLATKGFTYFKNFQKLKIKLILVKFNFY